LAKALDRGGWLTDARYATADLRRQHTRELQTELAAVFKTDAAEAWETRLSDAGIPCGMVRDVTEAVSLSGLRERGVTLPLRVPTLPGNKDIAIVNAGFLCNRDSPQVTAPPPRHGEHSDEILASLGFGTDERKAILAANSIGN
jgi:crotonobetainyl-CoA:carnitine CoA-transferase CaiB-like acyl-CoA transferase